MAEKKFDAQNNYGWGLTLDMTGKAPAINKRIFETLVDAQKYADNYNDSAVEGLILSVVNDKNVKNNGAYFIKSIKKNKNDVSSVLEKIGINYDIDGINHILVSETEPSEEYRKDFLWLQETEEEVVEDDFTVDIRTMQKAIIELTKVVQRHEYAFSNAMNCGTVSTNSTRTKLMQIASPEVPDGFYGGTTPLFLTELSETKQIKAIKNYYLASNLSYDIKIKDNEWEEICPDLNETKKYLWNYVEITFTDDSVKDSVPELIYTYNNIRIIEKIIDYYAVSDSADIAPLKTDNTYSEHLPTFVIDKPYLWRYVNVDYANNTNLEKPDEFGANVKHLIIKSAKSEQEIRDNLNNILNYEMVWCESNNGLYIKSKNKLVKINGTSGFTPDDEENNEIIDIMIGINPIEGQGIGSIDFISSNGTKYTMRVNNEGELHVYNSKLDQPISAPTGDAEGEEKGTVSALFLPKLYINSVYCGGEIDGNGNEINEHSINPCSHNFVELSNLTTQDINLNGLSLQYASNGTNWKVLPLWGTIKAGSTFLIRGAQCSITNLNTTVIKVNDYDMEWRGEDNELIKFSNKSAKFYLRYGTEPCDVENPFFYNSSKPADTVVKYGYIDLVGFSDGTNNPNGQENKVYNYLSSNRLFKKYYAMDNVSQATKAKDKRNNANDWYYIDLTRNDILRDIECYTPRSSSYGKNIFYDKSNLYEMKPTICTITFGIQATDNGSGATRCFNWVSKGYYDEYLWYRKKGDTDWIRKESHKNSSDDIEKYYNRICQEASNGDVFTSHKLIIRGLEAGEYEYTCGKSSENNSPNMNACIDIRNFIVRSNSELTNGFSFIQVSDQQGFNWDEYQVWAYAAKFISENYTPHFLINTGDMTQNGNRLNEWIDYFDGKTPLNSLEEMSTIGNNDLCPKIPYKLGDGGDSSKLNFANINFFYTFEIDTDNPPIFGDEDTNYGFIPSIYSFNYGNAHFMCLNSEISEKTETDILGIVNNKGIIYEKIKEWCEKDILKYQNYEWKIAYCHEMPFTIITDGVMSEFFDPLKNNGKEVAEKNVRGGSRINMVTKKSNQYWFSRFCQDNGIRLVMGGHKHTQAISWPIKENVKVDGSTITYNSMKPIIQVTSEDLTNDFNNAASLIEIVDNSSELNGQSFPNTWFIESSQNNETALETEISPTHLRNCHFCTFELVEKITAPIYSMSQATGYKHTSNKELPGAVIPWCRYYFPNKNGKVNNEQRYPFFSIYNVSSDNITIDVKRIKNVLISGKFNINEQGEALRNNINKIEVDNGLSETTINNPDNNKKIIINK